MIGCVKYHLMFILVTALWGSNFILMKKAAQSFDPMMVGAGRLAGGVLFLLVVVVVGWGMGSREGGRGEADGGGGVDGSWVGSCGGWCSIVKAMRLLRQWPMLVVVFLGFVFPFVIQPHLIHKYQDSGFFAMPIALVPLLTVLVSVPMLGVYPTVRQLLGVLGGLVCMAVLFGVGVGRGVGWVDLLLVMSVPTSYAITNTTIKMKLSRVGAMPMGVVSMSVALLVLLLWGLVTPYPLLAPGVLVVFEASVATAGFSVSGGEMDAMFEGSSVMSGMALAWLGLLGTGLATWLFWKLIQIHGPLYASMVGYLVPIGALMWGWVDGEALSWPQVGAFAGIIVMVVLVQWRPVSRALPVLDVD